MPKIQNQTDIPKGQFYNTIHLKGEQLEIAFTQNLKQEEAVRLIFTKFDPRNGFTPADVFKILNESGYKFLLTDIRRAMHSLTNCKEPFLEKMSTMRKGAFTKPNHTWRIKK